MRVNAYAKLNLSLDILRRREDGYHELEMVMQQVDLADGLQLTPAKGAGAVSTSLSYLPRDERNLAHKAAAAFRAATGTELEVDVAITKRIPVCAGLGGGSADAAAVLHAMNEMTGAGLSIDRLAQIGARVGSDVPYCVLGGTALARGRGEVLTPLPALPTCWAVVCKPPFPISTPQLFARVDVRRIPRRPDTPGIVAALEAGDLTGVCRRMYNVFEDVLDPRRRRRIEAIKTTLIDCGALGASMSGSGPSVFGLFEEEDAARLACRRLEEQHSAVFLCKTV